MNRLVPAAAIAIGLHGLLLTMDLDWMRATDWKRFSIGTVTITLESVENTSAPPKSEPSDSRRFAPQPKPKVIEKPVEPVVDEKPVKTAKIKAPLPKPAPEPPPLPAAPEVLTPSEQSETPNPQPVSQGSFQNRDASLPAPQQEKAENGAEPMAAISRPAASVPIEAAMPEYGKNPPISYPISARKKGYTGTVILEVLVNRNGEVNDLRILASSGYAILDRSAAKSVRTWSFKPAKKGDDAIEMWVQVPIQFKLE